MKKTDNPQIPPTPLAASTASGASDTQAPLALNWEMVPRNFGLCASQACPRCEECLHRRAADLMPAPPASPPLYIYVNHLYRQQAEQAGAPCPEYLPAEPVRMALGFRRALDEELTYAARRRAVAQLKALFSGGHMFYDRLNGVMPLTPQEQKAVGRILAACGAAEPVEFDAYTELFDFDLRLTSEEIPGNQGI